MVCVVKVRESVVMLYLISKGERAPHVSVFTKGAFVFVYLQRCRKVQESEAKVCVAYAVRVRESVVM